MKIHLEFFAQASESAGFASRPYELPAGATLEDLLRCATADNDRLHRLLFPENKLSQSLVIAVNDLQVPNQGSLPLQDRDEILIIPAVSGG